MKRITRYGLFFTLILALVLILSACTSSTPTPSPSAVISPTISATPTLSASPTISPTPSISPSPAPVPTPTITNTSLQDGELGMPYSETLQASGGSGTYTWSISSDFLPLGLSLDSNTGTISGTPTAPATYFFGVMVTDKNGTNSNKVYTINIALSPSATPPPVPSPTVTPTTPATPNPTASATPVQFAISTNGLPDSGVGVSYSQALQTVGGAPPYRWSYWNGPLPEGLFLDAATGIIFGKPTKAGTFNFTVEVNDTTGAIAGRAFTLRVNG